MGDHIVVRAAYKLAQEEAEKTTEVLDTPLPLPLTPAAASHNRLLSGALALSIDQNTAQDISTAVTQWIATRPGADERGGLLKHLVETVGDSGYESSAGWEKVERLLASPEAENIGKHLQVALQGVASAADEVDWVVIALLIEVGALYESPHYEVAGYDLTQEINWGHSVPTIIQRLDEYLAQTALIDTDKALQQTSPVCSMATYLLLAHAAPAFVVRDLPGDIIYGSTAWALFTATVWRLERQVPGICVTMTYAQIMAFVGQTPVSPEQAANEDFAWRVALIEWGTINGVLDRTFDEGDLAFVHEKYNQQVLALAESVEYCQAKMPTRRELADLELEDLVGGDGVNVVAPLYREKGGANNELTLVELYMRGWLPGIKVASKYKNDPLYAVADRLEQLPQISKLFNEAVLPYIANLEAGFTTLVKSLLAQLPLEDRKCIDIGDVTVYSLRSGFAHSPFENYNDRVAQLTWHHGALLRAQVGTTVNYYEVVPGIGSIRKNTRLPFAVKTGYRLGGGSLGDDPVGSDKRHGYHGQGYEFECTDYVYSLAIGDKGRGAGAHFGIILDEIELRHDPLFEHVIVSEDPYGPPTFFSEKTHVIAQAIARHMVGPHDILKREAWGMSLQDERDAEAAKWRELVLEFIPLYSAIKSFINGNVALGLFYVSLDVFGLMLAETGGPLKVALLKSFSGKSPTKALFTLAKAPPRKPH